MRFVVTGATSFIGLELIDYLIKQQHKVIGVCRPNSNGLSKIPSGAHVVFANMSEYSTLNKVIKSADIFINLAWDGTGHGQRNDVNIQHDNIKNTISSMQAAKKMGCKLFVEAGSQAEYGTITEKITENTPCHPFSEYGKAKLTVQKELFALSEQLDIKYIHLRIFSLFGENDHPWTLIMSSIDKMLRNDPIELSSCTQKWNFLYVKDAVNQIVMLCNYAVKSELFRHEIYNIASNDTRVLKDFLVEMYSLTSSKSKLNFGAITPINIVSLNPDISKTENTINYISKYTFKEVIDKIICKYKQKNYDKG